MSLGCSVETLDITSHVLGAVTRVQTFAGFTRTSQNTSHESFLVAAPRTAHHTAVNRSPLALIRLVRLPTSLLCAAPCWQRMLYQCLLMLSFTK